MNQSSINRKLTVLLITNLFPTPQDPLRGIFVANMVKELNKKCNVTVLSILPWVPKLIFFKRSKRYRKLFSVPFKFEVEGIKVYCPKYIAIPKIGFLHTFFIFLSIFFWIRKLKKMLKIDLINTHWIFPDGVASSWIAELLNLPLVLSARGCDINLYSTFKLKRPQIIKALKSAQKITVVSNAQKEVVAGLGFSNGKIAVVKNGIEFDRFNVKDKTECRKKLGFRQNSKITLFVGQIIEVKGFNYLVEAAYLLNKEYKNGIKVVVIGEGNQRKQIERRILELGLNGEIGFFGEKSREEIPYWYGACDLLCLPSIREGCPNVILESLACGRPVVASKVGGISELINDGNGVLFEPKNIQELTDSLWKALNQDWNEEEIRHSIDGLTWESTANKYFNVFQKVLLERSINK